MSDDPKVVSRLLDEIVVLKIANSNLQDIVDSQADPHSKITGIRHVLRNRDDKLPSHILLIITEIVTENDPL